MRKFTFAVVFLSFFLMGCASQVEPAQTVFLDVTVRWPTTGLAKKLPEPTFGQLAGVTDTPDEFCAALVDVTQNDLRDYIGQVKRAGFTVNAETSDQECMGVEMYTYSAGNADGLVFTLTGTAGTCTITLTAPQTSP